MANQPGSENLSQEVTWVTTEASPLLTMYVHFNPHRHQKSPLRTQVWTNNQKPGQTPQLGGLGLPGGATSILRTK